jgi:hypothetical protein
MSNAFESCESVVPQSIFDRISGYILENNDMPWFYTYTAYNDPISENIHSFSFFHNAIFDSAPTSSMATHLEMVFLYAMEKTGQKVKQLIRARVGLLMPTPQPIIHEPHVDMPTPHKTALLYLNDADGDTLLYNEIYNPRAATSGFKYYKSILKEQVTVAAQSKPKANKMIWFDGFRYHSSTSPVKTARRVAVNFNYTTE